MKDDLGIQLKQFWKHFGEMSKVLAEDIIVLREEINKSDSQIMRRAYCRAIFSKIDGMNSLLKQHAEKFGDTDEDTILLLQDKRIITNKIGNKQTVKSFRRATDDLFFALETFAWTQDCEPKINRNSEGWKNLEYAVKIRNRITHPKSKQDLIISADDLKLLDKISRWHTRQVIEIFDFIAKSLKDMARMLMKNFYLEHPEAVKNKKKIKTLFD